MISNDNRLSKTYSLKITLILTDFIFFFWMEFLADQGWVFLSTSFCCDSTYMMILICIGKRCQKGDEKLYKWKTFFSAAIACKFFIDSVKCFVKLFSRTKYIYVCLLVLLYNKLAVVEKRLLVNWDSINKLCNWFLNKKSKLPPVTGLLSRI